MEATLVRTLCTITHRNACEYEYTKLGPTDMKAVVGANITYTNEFGISNIMLDTVHSIEIDDSCLRETVIINGHYLIKWIPKFDD